MLNQCNFIGRLGKDPELLNGIDPLSVVNRFWQKVKINDNGCWEWTGALSKGYGIMSSKRNNPPFKAHRISWAIKHGKIEKGMVIRHKCDNRKCVSPYHLEVGTQKDNMRDMVKRGRYNKKSYLNLHPGKKGFHGAGPKSNKENGIDVY